MFLLLVYVVQLLVVGLCTLLDNAIYFYEGDLFTYKTFGFLTRESWSLLLIPWPVVPVELVDILLSRNDPSPWLKSP